MATRQDYRDKFETLNEAIEFENYVLGSGDEFLPLCAKAVLDGYEPGDDYWEFLIDELEGM